MGIHGLDVLDVGLLHGWNLEYRGCGMWKSKSTCNPRAASNAVGMWVWIVGTILAGFVASALHGCHSIQSVTLPTYLKYLTTSWLPHQRPGRRDDNRSLWVVLGPTRNGVWQVDYPAIVGVLVVRYICRLVYVLENCECCILTA